MFIAKNLSTKHRAYNLSDLIKQFTIILTLAAIYYGVGKLGLLLALPIPPGNVTVVWLPSAVALAAVVWFGYGVLPGIWLGDILVNTPGYIETSHHITLSLTVGSITAIGASLEAFLGVCLLHKLANNYPFNHAKDVCKFIFIAITCPAINIIIALTGMCLLGIAKWVDFLPFFYNGLVGNSVSLIAFAPLLLTCYQYRNIKFTLQQLCEVMLWVLTLLAFGYIAFGLGYPVEYLFIPFLLWITFRFGHLGATTGVVIVSGIALWGTILGKGPFIRESFHESLLLLQSFMGVAAVTTLTLVSVLEERIASQKELATVNEELENRVELRTTALTEALQQLEETLMRLKQTQSQLIQAEKMSSLGQLVAGIAHEINNPVNFIYGNLAYIRDYSNNLLHLTQLYQQYYPNTLPQIQEQIDETDPNFIAQDLTKIIDSMQIGTQRIREIVLLLRNFSRLDEAEFKKVDIHEGIESTLMLLQHRLTLNDNSLHINVIKEYGTLPLVNCYASELNQVFLNILNNAIDAVSDIDITEKSTKQPTIWIYTQLTELNQIIISISDNGNGIPLDIQTKLFDPFFTTKAVGQGTGLGLFVSYQIIVSKHGGQLLCDSTLGHGTKFIIQIPASP